MSPNLEERPKSRKGKKDRSPIPMYWQKENVVI